MKKQKFLLIFTAILTFTLGNYALPVVANQLKTIKKNGDLNIDNSLLATQIEIELINKKKEYPKITLKQLNGIKKFLHTKTINLNEEAINKVLKTLKCSNENNIEHNNILTIIDYSLPSNKKRLWIFDLTENKLLFNTYVSHGLKSGRLFSKYFSNKYNSKSSSIGVYNTEKAYRGRHGPSLKLCGLDKDFNHNAYNRFIVMHGAWYVAEDFIKKYGRAGRSWGCPAVPRHLTQSIIDTIKEKSLFVVYYPNHEWFLKSKFLNCDTDSLAKNQPISEIETKPLTEDVKPKPREEILFADSNNNNKREENEPIIVMQADNYQRLFNSKDPLTRMLRRQIDNTEYIALSNEEIKSMIANNNPEDLNKLYFIIAVVKMDRGYYATEMQIVNLGKVKKIELNANSKQAESYTVYFEKRRFYNLKTTNQFIRWLGL